MWQQGCQGAPESQSTSQAAQQTRADQHPERWQLPLQAEGYVVSTLLTNRESDSLSVVAEVVTHPFILIAQLAVLFCHHRFVSCCLLLVLFTTFAFSVLTRFSTYPVASKFDRG